jgi:hypothetical protein
MQAVERLKLRQAASEGLARRSLGRRALLQLQQAAAASVAWRAAKAAAQQHGQQILLRSAVWRWKKAAKQARGVKVLVLKREQHLKWQVVAAWGEHLCLQRCAQD